MDRFEAVEKLPKEAGARVRAAKAVSLDFQREVGLKIYKKQTLSEVNSLFRLAQTHSLLSHPHTLALLHCFLHPAPTPFTVVLAAEPTLSTLQADITARSATTHSYSEDQLVAVLTQVAQSLQHTKSLAST